MKTLLVLRHAKSSWSNIRLDDHERPLNARGERDGPRMGELIRSHRLTPDVIISSDATRAQSTAESAAEAAGYTGKILLENLLYGAGAADIIAVLRTVFKAGTSIVDDRRAQSWPRATGHRVDGGRRGSPDRRPGADPPADRALARSRCLDARDAARALAAERPKQKRRESRAVLSHDPRRHFLETRALRQVGGPRLRRRSSHAPPSCTSVADPLVCWPSAALAVISKRALPPSTCCLVTFTSVRVRRFISEVICLHLLWHLAQPAAQLFGVVRQQRPGASRPWPATARSMLVELERVLRLVMCGADEPGIDAANTIARRVVAMCVMRFSRGDAGRPPAIIDARWSLKVLNVHSP